MFPKHGSLFTFAPRMSMLPFWSVPSGVCSALGSSTSDASISYNRTNNWKELDFIFMIHGNLYIVLQIACSVSHIFTFELYPPI